VSARGVLGNAWPVSSGISPGRRIATTLTWPLGISWTAWHYLWRTLPVYRSEEPGSLEADQPPQIPAGARRDDLQQPDRGNGPLFHRTYEAAITGSRFGATDLMAHLSADPDRVAPGRLARFRKTEGSEGTMRVGDEFIVHMPGPWDGPVRVVDVKPDSFRFATLDGHLEAGQIEWRAWEDDGRLHFAVESWSRSGDRLSAVMHDRLRMAKEVQLYMWTTIAERVAREAGGKLVDGVRVETKRVPPEAFD
jgi:hypothetical protein